MPVLNPITPQPHLSAFTGYGIELEYMIVDRRSLSARPLADRLLRDDAGTVVNEVAQGPVAWSNELAAHVIELKTNGPAPGLDSLDSLFARAIQEINGRLAAHDAMLLPTAMHPWFDPHADTVLWSHGQNEIYDAYDRIFGCRGHGWSNLQSTHINLPFANEAEFRRLHAAVRVVLPLIPALAASSPLEQGRLTGWCDRRLFHYRGNQGAIPEIAGLIVPEAVTGIAQYHEHILHPMYRAIAPRDPHGLLTDDWLNSRGAIARFERQTIEIRLVDVQECPAADLAVADALTRLVRRFYDAPEAHFDRQQALDHGNMSRVLFQLARHGGQGMIEDLDYLRLFGLVQPMTGQACWQHLLADGLMEGSPMAEIMERIVDRGSLAEAIVGRLTPTATDSAIRKVYGEMAECLQNNHLFRI
ncbi:glutamate--cysteine ligase [Wenzhouxiangella sp. AB-CW3]|uniref:carboxylate-amine ligase n=1 Tax=Wenzhouxiangella sp. AB-CW3 TaxID=2771012 RepID=UPI00168B4A98|nr:glutamate-cysteine ligase family protein [Wenzhouxiangella sp. AB-CW3]QOC21257.1 glutamate--cysteine ligase [Wenzhouxiangella sp. AB-CW3]